MRVSRSVATVLTLFAASTLAASPAFAAAPPNDTTAGAVAVTVGDSLSVDTTQATTDSDDAQLNASCGAPATDASVWYTVTVPSDTGVVVDVSQSDYSAGVLVGEGSPGSLETVACGPGAVGFFATGGTTYYVLAIDDQDDGQGNGGQLSISFNPTPPPPSLEVSLAPRGTFDSRTGVATLHGTYTCTDADNIEVFGDVTQTLGGRTGNVYGFFDIVEFDTCDGIAHTWTADVYPESGRFAGGKALTVAVTFACGAFECADGFAEQTVQLAGGRK
jgi:hypothetical protein